MNITTSDTEVTRGARSYAKERIGSARVVGDGVQVFGPEITYFFIPLTDTVNGQSFDNTDDLLTYIKSNFFFNGEAGQGVQSISGDLVDNTDPSNPVIKDLGYVDVQVNFNAAGDGISIDSIPIQQALDFIGQQGGGVVYLPPGVYLIDAPLRISSGTTLIGAGAYVSEIELQDFSDCQIITNENLNEGNSNIHLSDFSVNGNGDNQTAGTDESSTQECILFTRVVNGSIRNLHLRDIRHHAVSIDRGHVSEVGCENILVSNVHVNRTSGDGFEIETSSNIKLEYCTVQKAGDIPNNLPSYGQNPCGYEIEEGSENVTFFRCDAIDCGIAGFNFQSQPVCKNINILNCKVTGSIGFKEAPGYGIRLVTGDGTDLVEGLIVRDTIIEDCFYAVGPGRINDGRFINCRINRCNSVRMVSASTVQFLDCEFKGAQVGDSAFTTIANTASAIERSDAGGGSILIKNCKISGYYGYGVFTVGFVSNPIVLKIESCEIFDNGLNGVISTAIGQLTVTDSLIKNNCVNATSGGQRVGVVLGGASDFNARIINNLFIDEEGTQLQACGSTSVWTSTENITFIIKDNEFIGGQDIVISYPTQIYDLGGISNNKGFITESKGVATISSGNTDVSINNSDSLWRAVSSGDVIVTPTSTLGAATQFWAAPVDSETWGINVDVDPGVDVSFSWRVF